MTALKRSRLLRALAGLLLVLLAASQGFGWRPAPLLSSIDRHLYDGRQLALEPVRDPRIVIIDIDEASLAEQGQWPWPRRWLAEMVDSVFTKGRAAALGLDMVFAEPDPRGDTEGDLALAKAMAGRPVVLGYYLTREGGRRSGTPPPGVLDRRALDAHGNEVIEADGYAATLPELARQAAGQGFVNDFAGASVDADGTTRALPLLAVHEASVHQSFALAALRSYLGNARLSVESDALRLQGSRGELTLPLSAGYTALIPFAGSGGPQGGRFLYLSARDVLEGGVDWSLLEGRLVLLGTSAPALAATRATPVNRFHPSVELHASLISGALDERLKRRLPEAGLIGGVTTLLVGGGLALALPALGAIGTVLACGVAALTLVGGYAIAYSNFGLVLPLAAGLAALASLAVFNLLFGYLAEGRSRRAVLKLFGEYLSPAVVEEMARDPVRWQIAESRNAELTILFADIRGFTRMAESMDPAALRDYLNTVFTGLSNIIHWHGGTVDKYIGDAVMAFWGAPVDDPDHADHAVEAAIAMQQEARRMSADFVMRGLPPLAIGIGINTGLARVGDMGSAVRRTYTALGDAVNLASRLETLTKRYEVPILIGEATVRACRTHRFDELVPALIDGRTEPVRVFAPTRPAPATPAREVSAPVVAAVDAAEPLAPVVVAVPTQGSSGGAPAATDFQSPTGAADEASRPRV